MCVCVCAINFAAVFDMNDGGEWVACAVGELK